jgi:hypothetical protein
MVEGSVGFSALLFLGGEWSSVNCVECGQTEEIQLKYILKNLDE